MTEENRTMIMNTIRWRVAWALMGLALASLPVRAATNSWTGSSGNDWFAAGNWSLGHVPQGGESVWVTNVPNTILLTNSTACLSSFVIAKTSLVFTNWNTALTATNVTVGNGGCLTVPPAFSDSAMSNRIFIVCTHLTLENGGVISVSSNGYLRGYGPAKGTVSANTAWGGGGGHGGKGGNSIQGGLAGSESGSVGFPDNPGSGGFDGGPGYGGNGGGVVKIQAGGTVVIDGTVQADGQSSQQEGWPYCGGGGAGGSIFITCDAFGGSGLLKANGGNGHPTLVSMAYAGAGGGGRIAIHYQSLSGTPAVKFSTKAGQGFSSINPTHWAAEANNGTVYLSKTNLLSNTLKDQLFSGVRLVIPSFTSWTVSDLTVSNCAVFLEMTGMQVNVTGHLRVDQSGVFGLGTGAILTCNGNLILTNGGALYVYSGPTIGTTSYGALVDIGGDMLVGPSSWVYPFCDREKGGSVLFQMKNIVIATNAGFNADARGWKRNMGPGKGGLASNPAFCGGGGYGGTGGAGYTDAAAGSVYGSLYAPIEPGSGGGGANFGGDGGGAIRIMASGMFHLKGTLTANGGDYGYSIAAHNGGGGSGGGILIHGAQVTGDSTAILRANGGNYNAPGDAPTCGGGGGGRIAVWQRMPDSLSVELRADQIPDGVLVTNSLAAYLGSLSTAYGTGRENPPGTNSASAGTAVFIRGPLCGPVFLFD
jgi:large repetitive protein